MADALNLFDARRSKWTNPDGTLSREAQIFLRDLWVRVGGAQGSSNNDLSASQFEDAGIEETRALLLTLANAAGQNPPTVHERITHLETIASELAALLAETRKEVQGLQQGLTA